MNTQDIMNDSEEFSCSVVERAITIGKLGCTCCCYPNMSVCEVCLLTTKINSVCKKCDKKIFNCNCSENIECKKRFREIKNQYCSEEHELIENSLNNKK